VYNWSCWGITLRSVTNGREERKRKKALGIKGWLKGPAEEQK